MDILTLGNSDISRIGLGSVQFGVDYGINNTAGQVSYGEIVKILVMARQKGINFIDTSNVWFQ